ncbi:MAG: PQQ-binding-like beta-propeller repeat protein [bacterium]
MFIKKYNSKQLIKIGISFIVIGCLSLIIIRQAAAWGAGVWDAWGRVLGWYQNQQLSTLNWIFSGGSYPSYPSTDTNYTTDTNYEYDTCENSTDPIYTNYDNDILTPSPGTKFELNAQGEIYASLAVGIDGTIYIAVYNGWVYAINPIEESGWSFWTGGNLFASPTIDDEGTIYIGSLGGDLYALNPDGTEKWKISRSKFASTPAIGDDGTLYIGSYNNILYAINPEDGTEKWRFVTGDKIVSSPSIGENGTIYVGSYDTNLYAINPDGTEKWRFPTKDKIFASPAIGRYGTIYIGSYDGNFYAINTNGTLKWSFLVNELIQSSPAIDPGETIYFGAGNGNLYALNPDGTEKWAFDTGTGVHSSPGVGKDGTIFIGTEDNMMYALNPDSTVKWKFETDAEIFSSPTILDKIMYIATCGGTIYGIYIESEGLADTPWPMFHKNIRHTGLNRLIKSDRENPHITITDPTGGDAYKTISQTVTISGIASDNDSISMVTYTTEGATRTEGNAIGTSTWFIDNLHLDEGVTNISVIVYDSTGNVGKDTLKITFDNSEMIAEPQMIKNQSDSTNDVYKDTISLRELREKNGCFIHVTS